MTNVRRTIMGKEIKVIASTAIRLVFLNLFCELVCCKGHRQVLGDGYTRGEHSDQSNEKEGHTIKSGMQEIVDNNGKREKSKHANALRVGALAACTRFSICTWIGAMRKVTLSVFSEEEKTDQTKMLNVHAND